MESVAELHAKLASLDTPIEPFDGTPAQHAKHVAHVTAWRAIAKTQLASRIAAVTAGRPDPLEALLAKPPV